MKNSRYHGILNYKRDIAEQKLTNEQIINLLVNHGVLIKSNEDKSDLVKSLNQVFRPVNNEHLLYATIIFRNDCYFLSKDYLNEAVNFILHHALKNGNEHLKSREHFYDIKNESFINLDDKKEYYKKELEGLIRKKHQLSQQFGLENFHDENLLFSERVKNYLELNLHENPEFNSRYIFGFNSLKNINLFSYFDNIEELVYLKKLIDKVKFELSKKDLKEAEVESFSTLEAVVFFEIIGFLKLDEKISFRKQAEIISKLIGKNPDNIRKAISKFDSKNPKIQESLINTHNDIKEYLNKLGYPVE